MIRYCNHKTNWKEKAALYSKIIFFVLISILGLAVGVIVFQLGPLKDQEIKVEKIADIPESQPEVQLDVPQAVISGMRQIIINCFSYI